MKGKRMEKARGKKRERWIIRIRFRAMENSVGYLEHMAARGWMLESWKGTTLIFRRCEPVRLRFSLDMMPMTGRKLDDGTHNRRREKEYLELCEEMGWHYADSRENLYLFYTENDRLPPLQTDPEAYRTSVYAAHRKKRNLYGAILAAFLVMSGAALRGTLYRLLLDKRMLFSGILLMIVFMAALLMFAEAALQVRREGRYLRQGKLPELKGNDIINGIIEASMVLLYPVSAVGMLIGSDFQSVAGWVLLFAAGARGICSDVMPYILQHIFGESRESAKELMKTLCQLLLIVCNMALLSGPQTWPKPVTREWPQEMVPVITAGELGGEGKEEASFQGYEGALAELYTYKETLEDCSVWYRLYISDFTPALRSFCKDPDGLSHLAYNYGEKWKNKAETVGLEWRGEDKKGEDEIRLAQMYVGSGYPYEYLLRTDHAALFLAVSRPMTDEMLETVCARLLEIGK